MRASLVSIGTSAVLLIAASAFSQEHVGGNPSNPATTFKDTSLLKPPPGVSVAVFEWEDLECPSCAHAFPVVHAALAKTRTMAVERDYLIPGHIWSPTAALYARYLHDKISPELATDYRREVFASQYRIASRDDLLTLTEAFFHRNGKEVPFVIDPTGLLQREIDTDVELGRRVGVAHTPTIVVVTATHWTEVLDPFQLEEVISRAKQLTDTRH